MLLYFRCYQSSSVTIAGVTGAVLFVLAAVALVCSIYAYFKRRENEKLKEEINNIELKNENSNLIVKEKDATRNQVTSEIPLTSAEGLPVTST